MTTEPASPQTALRARADPPQAESKHLRSGRSSICTEHSARQHVSYLCMSAGLLVQISP